MSSNLIIKLPKRFDYSASSFFNEQIKLLSGTSNPSEKTIIIDCSELDYIDSAGIGLFVMAHKRVSSLGYSLAIQHVKQSVKDILMLANLHKLIDIK